MITDATATLQETLGVNTLEPATGGLSTRGNCSLIVQVDSYCSSSQLQVDLSTVWAT